MKKYIFNLFIVLVVSLTAWFFLQNVFLGAIKEEVCNISSQLKQIIIQQPASAYALEPFPEAGTDGFDYVVRLEYQFATAEDADKFLNNFKED